MCSSDLRKLSRPHGQVPYVLLTRSPLGIRRCLVRLACIRHAASVHPEPGSNSPFDIDSFFVSVISFFLFRCFSRNRRVILVLSYLYVFFLLKLFVSVRFSKIVPRCRFRQQMNINSFAEKPSIFFSASAHLIYHLEKQLSTKFSTFFTHFLNFHNPLSVAFSLLFPPCNMQAARIQNPGLLA